jgi:hypothetical protein
MSKKKLAGIMVGCIVAIIVLVVIFTRSSTPTPLTASERNYALAMADHGSRVVAAMSEASNLMENAQIGNDEWIQDLATQLARIRLLYDEALEMEPPSSMVDIHYKYIQAMSHIDTCTDFITEGIDTLNVNLLDQAKSESDMAMEYMGQAADMLSDFLAAHSH